jgi:hypothetical protein
MLFTQMYDGFDLYITKMKFIITVRAKIQMKFLQI